MYDTSDLLIFIYSHYQKTVSSKRALEYWDMHAPMHGTRSGLPAHALHVYTIVKILYSNISLLVIDQVWVNGDLNFHWWSIPSHACVLGFRSISPTTEAYRLDFFLLPKSNYRRQLNQINRNCQFIWFLMVNLVYFLALFSVRYYVRFSTKPNRPNYQIPPRPMEESLPLQLTLVSLSFARSTQQPPGPKLPIRSQPPVPYRRRRQSAAPHWSSPCEVRYTQKKKRINRIDLIRLIMFDFLF